MKGIINRYAPIVIIVAATCVTVPRLAAAFAMVEPGFLGVQTAWVTGPGYGVLEVAAVAYSLQTYQERRRLRDARYLLWGLGVILFLSTIIMLPGMIVQVRTTMLDDALPAPFDALWCAALALSPTILVALSALAASLKREVKEKPAKKKLPVRPAVKEYAYSCTLCDWGSDSPHEYSAHVRWQHPKGGGDATTE